jgi:ABC-2 type transport system permease protein
MLSVLTTGIAMLLSALFVRFRDISPIWEVLSQILFYSSPVIIPAEAVREKLAHGALDHFLYHLYTLNPLVAIFQQFRHAMINRATLSADQVMGSGAALLEPLALAAVIFVVGFWVFNRDAPHIAEDL